MRLEKKIDTRKSRKKEHQETLKNPQNMEETRNKDDAMRKNMRQNTEEKRVQK